MNYYIIISLTICFISIISLFIASLIKVKKEDFSKASLEFIYKLAISITSLTISISSYIIHIHYSNKNYTIQFMLNILYILVIENSMFFLLKQKYNEYHEEKFNLEYSVREMVVLNIIIIFILIIINNIQI